MKNLYIGIDLGTTNSVIAYGNMMANGQLKSNVVSTDRKSENGGNERKATLPSVVFYSKNTNNEIVPIVGDYAKNQYGKKYGYVCKSVKSLMGNTDEVKLNTEIEDRTPADVSAQILKQMLNSAQKQLFLSEIPEDVIITVPASFDSDQCQDTLDAAKKAGINVDNEHDVLLYEPKAVIYDFVHMQEMGEIPSTVIDLSTDKNILVFDLGGGTLDVTLHRVGYKDNDLLNIEDIAISRYTQIGGDNFDEILAEKMLERFQEQNGISVKPNRKDEVMCILRKKAEMAKIEVSDAFTNSNDMGIKLPDDYEISVMEINLYDAYSYDDIFTKGDIEEIISPLMGHHLSAEDVKRIDSIPERDINNIIYPIIDVLAKAGSGVKVDAVLLNGGMTKFYPIKERIDKFLNLNSISILDPDLTVARGAVYYHYCLHKYGVKKVVMDEHKVPEVSQQHFNTNTILNDTINLGIKGEYVSKLVEAGTPLPYISQEISDKYILSEDTNKIALEIFLGRGLTKNLPNRRIATRVIEFDRVYPAGTKVSIRLIIDPMRLISIDAWITGHPNEKATVKVDAAKQSDNNTKSKVGKVETVERIVMNAKSEINEIKALSLKLKTKLRRNVYDDTLRKIDANINRIAKAQNGGDFFGPIVDTIKSASFDEPLRGCLYKAASNLAVSWTDEQRKAFLKICKEHFKESYTMLRQNNQVLREAITFISLWGEDYIDYSYGILSNSYFSHIHPAIIEVALSKNVGYESMLDLFCKCSTSKLSVKSVYMIGYHCSRERNIIASNRLEKVVNKLILILETSSDISMSTAAVFALGEICDTREGRTDIVNKTLLEKVSAAISSSVEKNAECDYNDFFNKANLAYDMVSGDNLSEEQRELLLKTRLISEELIKNNIA